MKREYGVDLDAARLSRERNRTYTNAYYDEQAHILAQWIDKKPPANLVISDIPIVNLKQIRFDAD